MKIKRPLRRELYGITDNSNGGLPIIPVDERGAEILGMKMGRLYSEAKCKGGDRTTKYPNIR